MKHQTPYGYCKLNSSKMGNEMCTVGGAIATVGTSVAAGVTFGQVDALNNAVVECAKYTGNAAANTTVRHVGETVGSAAATAGAAVAAGVTLGQVEALNDAVVNLAEHTGVSAVESGKSLVNTANDFADGIPGVGHIKGGIHYACGDTEGGDKAMKSASRTVGVVAGGVVGIPAGPAGMVAGGIAGGVAMDGITTGVESAIKGKYIPSGSVKAWNNVVEGKDAQTVIDGVVGGMMTPVMDGMGGYAAGKSVMKMKASSRGGFEIEGANEPIPRNPNPALNEFMAQQQGRGRNSGGRASVSTTSFKSARSGSAATSSFQSAISNYSEQSTSWASAVSKASSHGSVIHMADLENVTIYRGVRRGMSPFKAGGHGSELGPGMYFTDKLEVAREYATTDPNTGRRVPGDVYRLKYNGQIFKGYKKYWTEKYGGSVKNKIRQEEFYIIKTRHGNANQYRIGPYLSLSLEKSNALNLHGHY